MLLICVQIHNVSLVSNKNTEKFSNSSVAALHTGGFFFFFLIICLQQYEKTKVKEKIDLCVKLC